MASRERRRRATGPGRISAVCAFQMLTAAFLSLSLLPPLSTVHKEPLPYTHQQVTRRALLGVAVTTTSALRAGANDDRSSGIPEFKSVATQVGGDDFVSIGSAGLKYKEVRTGSGALVQAGDTVAIQFSGRCLNLNGKRFISTQDAAALTTGLAISEPFTFVVGSPTVIPGLSQAVVGMSKDGYRRVVVPQELGYDPAMTLQPLPEDFDLQRALASIVKNPNRDASLLFDVKLERIKARNEK